MKNKLYGEGFVVKGDGNTKTEIWKYSREFSAFGILVFQGYDTNGRQLPNFSDRSESEQTKKVIQTALEFTKLFHGSVWLDDYQVK